jgi:hypothetical protein
MKSEVADGLTYRDNLCKCAEVLRRTVDMYFPRLMATDEDTELVEHTLRDALHESIQLLGGEEAVIQQSPPTGGWQEFFAQCEKRTERDLESFQDHDHSMNH